MTVGIPLGFAALLFGVVALAGSTSSTGHRVAPPTALATPTPAPSVPPIADLTPELSHTPLDDTPEVQALRHASTAIAWARLQGSCDFPEARQWLHPEILESRSNGLCWPISRPGTGVGQAGPDAYEPLEIIHHDDGTVDVLVCQVAQPVSRFDVRTREPAARALTGHSVTTSRLITTERGYQLLPGPFYSGPIQECEPREPVTIQVFVDWQHTPLFTAFADTTTRTPSPRYRLSTSPLALLRRGRGKRPHVRRGDEQAWDPVRAHLPGREDARTTAAATDHPGWGDNPPDLRRAPT